MEYRLATEVEVEAVHKLVESTIKTIYPKYYPTEVVKFFCTHHNRDAIVQDVANGKVSILIIENEIVGTGCFVNNHITRVYVLPKHQGKGYGTFIVEKIEAEIKKNYDKAFLDASLPAARLYEKLGYKTIKHEKYLLENEVILVYEVMEKELHSANTEVNYDGKFFVPKMNSENGEVDGQTVFSYHQNGNLLWAEYSGGDVIKGTLIGTVKQNGCLEFTYQHVNTGMQTRVGMCQSRPKFLENGKLELTEEWQWMNGDCSKGTSVLAEVTNDLL